MMVAKDPQQSVVTSSIQFKLGMNDGEQGRSYVSIAIRCHSSFREHPLGLSII